MASQHSAVPLCRGPVNDHIEAAPIIRVHTGRCGVHQPLLWHYLAFGAHGFSRYADPRVFQRLSSPGEKSGARASESVVTEPVNLPAAAVCRSASAVADGERHAQAAA